MRSVLLWLIILVTIPAVPAVSDCTKMERDLARLRKEFHEFVSAPKKDGTTITFDEIADKLDKIVDIKSEMRKEGCKIPPRIRPWESE